MLTSERQLRKHKKIKKEILNTARDIISREGIQGLSIRKITKAMEYSPGIIYHYFKNKDEIIEALTNEGYNRILDSIKLVKRNDNNPEEEIKEMLINYIKSALASPEEYKAFMLNNDASVLNKTGLLKKGIAKNSQPMQLLYKNIEKGIKQGCYKPYDPELTAQIIWTSTFGLIIKIIIERNITQEQVNRLIDHHFSVLFNGIMADKKNI